MGPKDSKITHFVGLSANIDLVGGFNQLEKILVNDGKDYPI